MNKKDYETKIRSVGKKLIDEYIAKGHVKTGINGPYDDPETEVRNLSHLIVITAIECVEYGNSEYRKLVEKMGTDLLAMKSPDGTYKMRQKVGKDQCNGVIGHAWLNEGFLYAYKVLRDDKYLYEAVRVCKMHQFNTTLGLWGRPLKGIDDVAIDFTYNHQLWYAATLAEILTLVYDKELGLQLKTFMRKLPKNTFVASNGRIRHSIYNRISYLQDAKMKIKYALEIFKGKIGIPGLKYKEEGYHVFNLMALARLYRLDPNDPFFASGNFIASLDFITKDYYKSSLLSSNESMDASTHGNTLTSEESSINIYGYPYNVVGFELAYCGKVFNSILSPSFVNRIVEEQFAQTWDQDRKEFGLKCHDRNTVNYRVYEYYRYLEIEDNV